MIIWLAIGAALLLQYYLLITGEPVISAESSSVLDLARSMQEGKSLQPTNHLLLVAPFYPYLLSWTSLSPGMLYAAIPKLHFAIHLISMIFVRRVFKKHLPLVVIAGLSLFMTSALQRFGLSIQSDWVAAHLFLVLLVLGWGYLRDGFVSYFFWMAVTGAFLILTDSIFIAVLLLFPILAVLQSRERRNHVVLSTLALIFCWLLAITPNVYRYEKASITPEYGLRLAGVAYLLDQFTKGDLELSASVNRHYETLRALPSDSDRYAFFVRNIEREVRNSSNSDYFKFNERMFDFAFTTIRQHKRAYFRHIFSEVFGQITSAPVWINVFLVTAFICVFLPIGEASRLFLAGMLLLYEIYVLFCASIGVLSPSLVLISLVPILGVIGLELSAALYVTRRHRPAFD